MRKTAVLFGATLALAFGTAACGVAEDVQQEAEDEVRQQAEEEVDRLRTQAEGEADQLRTRAEDRVQEEIDRIDGQ